MDVIRDRRFWLLLGPSLVLIGLAVVVPDQAPLLAGGAVGWVLVDMAVLRGQTRMEYQSAIRSLRRGDYAQAICVMDGLIQAEPDTPEHYRFRANLYRLAGDWKRAEQDCEQIIRQMPGSADAYLGLAELYMQHGELDRAREYAQAALERDTRSAMIAYNLGWIEDRRGDAAAAAGYIDQSLAAGLPYSHYRLLARLWLARNYHRLGRDDEARQQLQLMRKQAKGVHDWRIIFESEQGTVLRDLFEEDVRVAQQLLTADATLEALD
jgi:tetratricopeptide (TPR) repeat protein